VSYQGSRVLQVRLALGGKVGATVTLLSTEAQDLLTRIGEVGEVRSINQDGTITIDWDRGGRSRINLSDSEVEVHA
jgi:putative heme degradation protein